MLYQTPISPARQNPLADYETELTLHVLRMKQPDKARFAYSKGTSTYLD